MINVQTPFKHHFLQVLVTQRMAQIPTYAQKNDLSLKMTPCERARIIHDEELLCDAPKKEACTIAPSFLQHNLSEEEIEQVRLNYGSHANYDDYKIVTPEGKLDGRHGIRLGQPGVTVLDFFTKDLPVVDAPMETKATGKRTRKKTVKENKTGYSTMKPTVETKAWADDVRKEEDWKDE